MKGFVAKKLGGKFQRCFYPFEECKANAINAHSIQNQKVLELLVKDGHVIMPKMKMDFEKGPQVSFDNVGRTKATTFLGLCKDHDNSLFKKIDDNEIDITDQEHLFLLCYRSVLKELHASMKAAHDIQGTYLKGVDLGKFNPEAENAPMLLATEKLMAAYIFWNFKTTLDLMLFEKEWKKVSHSIFTINSATPTLAVSSVFSTDAYSEKTDGLAFLILNIYPTEKETVVVFSYLSDHKKEATNIFNSLFLASSEKIKLEISKIVLRKCENFVLSPRVYETFNKDQKESIINYFKTTAIDFSYDTDDPKIYLFGPK